jgi:hypothetical protein
VRNYPKPVYLGVTLDRKLSMYDQVRLVKENAISKLSTVRRLASTSWGVKASVVRTLYLGAVRSQMEYGPLHKDRTLGGSHAHTRSWLSSPLLSLSTYLPEVRMYMADPARSENTAVWLRGSLLPLRQYTLIRPTHSAILMIPPLSLQEPGGGPGRLRSSCAVP